MFYSRGFSMILQIQFPHIDPVFLNLGRIQLRWYGLMYMISFIIGYFLLKGLVKQKRLKLSADDLYDLLFYIIIGVMVGGRIGYVLFYDLRGYLQTPLDILKIWQGGMSFHGGFIGVILALLYVTKKKGWAFWEIGDLISVGVPIGLGLGRIGNFINGELFGRPTTLPWGIVFPEGGEMPRHPSQLYEALLEGLVLFVILRWLFKKNYQPGTVSWGLIAFYGLFRFLVEFVREPDAQIGFDLGPFTRGQLLTLPLLVVGFWKLFTYVRRGHPEPKPQSSKSRAH
jgi:phosphatidylglycerol:prolipoprotein diacylglycerol transferase